MRNAAKQSIKSASAEFDFLPADPPACGDELNEVLARAVQYVLAAYGGASCGVQWCADFGDQHERFSFLVVIGGEVSPRGGYAGREAEVGFILQHLSTVGHPEVIDFLDTVRGMWWVDGDDPEYHQDDVDECWGDLVAGLQVARYYGVAR